MAGGLINFSSLETVLKQVSEQQKLITATLTSMQEEVLTLAAREELDTQEQALSDGCAVRGVTATCDAVDA